MKFDYKILFFMLLILIGFSLADSIIVEAENDLFGGSDRDYTHGTRLTYLKEIEKTPINYSHSTHSLFQFIYTPNNIAISEPQPNDRPWAGMSGYEYWKIIGNPRNFVASGFQVGVIGPSAFAEESQKVVHEWSGSKTPMGWDNQIDDRIFATYLAQVGFRFVDNKYFDMSNHYNMVVGTSFSNVGTSFVCRFGWNIPQYFPRLGTEPSTRGGSEELNNIFTELANISSIYFIAGSEFRYVFFNELITDSENDITLSNWITDFFTGVIVGYKDFEIRYQYTIRNREFKEDDKFHGFGKISISFPF